jgi:signal transduction histidine kinase
MEKLAIREMVEGITSMYEPAAALQNNLVLNRIAADITLVSDADILKLVIRNLVDNANKYMQNGTIAIDAFRAAGSLRITITDTGHAMDKELVARILDGTYRTGNGSHGFGYRIILELLAKINGVLSIDHPGETGNRITLKFSNADG